MDTVIPEETDTLAALDHASGDALAACPFCGGEVQSDNGAPGYIAANVECAKCDLHFYGSTEAQAITAWNTRTDPLHTAALAAGYATVPEWVGAMVGEKAKTVDLLAKSVADITAALVLGGNDKLISHWTAPYVEAINAHDARAALTKVQADV